MKVTGTIKKSDLEGGLWMLEAGDGTSYQLTGKLDGAKDGMTAEVEGKVDKNVMGFGMAGPTMVVTSIKLAK
jgi:hypothetical protein